MSSTLNNERMITHATIQNGLDLILGSDHPAAQLWAEQTAESLQYYPEGHTTQADWLFEHMIRYTWAGHLSDHQRMVLGMKNIGDVHDVELHLAHE